MFVPICIWLKQQIRNCTWTYPTVMLILEPTLPLLHYFSIGSVASREKAISRTLAFVCEFKTQQQSLCLNGKQ